MSPPRRRLTRAGAIDFAPWGRRVALAERTLWERPAGNPPAPKEQRPRKLSGTRTAGGWHSGKRRSRWIAWAAHRRGKPERSGRQARSRLSGQSFRFSDRGGRPLTRAGLRRCLECALSVVPVPDAIPLKTPLHALHVSLGARMVPFAGYDMPVQFPVGILAEHQWVRAHAGLFDVSHMGQVSLKGAGAAIALERLVPGDLQALKTGRIRYTMFTNERAGILDDLMVTRREDGL